MFECFLTITAESVCIGIEIRFITESGCYSLQKKKNLSLERFNVICYKAASSSESCLLLFELNCQQKHELVFFQRGRRYVGGAKCT